MASLIVRAQELNAEPRLAYRVVALIAFGSYLSDKPQLNDIDVAVWLEQKPGDPVHFVDSESMERIAVTAWAYLRRMQPGLSLVPVREADLVRRLNAVVFMETDPQVEYQISSFAPEARKP